MIIKKSKSRIVILFLGLMIGIVCNNSSPQKVEQLEEGKHMASLTIEQAQQKHQNKIMKLPGVVGIGIGAVQDEKVIKVLVIKKTPALEQKIPEQLEGYSVLIEETGEIRAL